MRLICTLHDQNDAKRLSQYLASKEIENEVDVEINGDWGSSDYGSVTYRLWVIDEDAAQDAYAIYKDYLAEPSNPRFDISSSATRSTKEPPPPPPPIKPAPSLPPITRFLLILCCVLYAWSSWNSPEYTSSDSTLTIAPIYTSPLKKEMLYDFPEAYSILANLVERYGIDALQNPQTLPPQGTALITEFKDHPYWQGYYEKILQWIHDSLSSQYVPWFEKIQQGEFWRIISPIFLHGDIFHLFFNMIWLYVLGRQLELHLGAFRYILFILLAAAFSNTAQYLMGGPNFLGFSGVLSAMLTFIWRRQVEAPWEGYQLQRITFIFIMIFILGMAAIQFLAFLLEAFTGTQVNTIIANTAHLTGALIGLVLARIPYFTHDRT